MGFFSKIKDNLNHGGLKIQLQAPASISSTDQNIPVTVTLQASDEQRTIEKLSLSIISEYFQMNSTDNMGAGQNRQSDLARVDFTEPITLMPGESKTLQLSISMGQGTLAEKMPGELQGTLKKVGLAMDTMQGKRLKYYIDATVKVQGLAVLGPSDRHTIDITDAHQGHTQITGSVQF